MAGRLYRMAKVVSANPKSWGIVDANEISGFKRVARLSDLYSIAECILSSSYGDGVTDGADAVGQIWHVSETNGDYKLINWANRKSAAGWTKLSYGGDVSVPVKDVHVNNTSVLSNGIANINLTDYAKKSDVTNNLKNYIAQAEKGVRNGVAPLDRDNMIPLQYLGHLDTTIYKVLGTNEALPTTGIKRCIYLKLIEAGNPTGNNNKYAEYVYTGDIAGTYDATKWEKLGEVAAKTDLSEYYKKTEVYNKTEINDKVGNINNSINNHAINTFTAVPYVAARPGEEHEDQYTLNISLNSGTNKTAYIKPATNNESGVMTSSQKIKLDGIAVGANNYVHPSYTSTPTKALYKINVDGHGHVSGYADVTKKDIIDLGIIDTAMSATSTNAVQNKVIDNAIKTHKIDHNNLDGNLPGTVTDYSILGENTENGNVSSLAESFVFHFDPMNGSSWLSINGSTVWDDTSLRALTDTELNEILK